MSKGSTNNVMIKGKLIIIEYIHPDKLLKLGRMRKPHNVVSLKKGKGNTTGNTLIFVGYNRRR
jgi:hypothetical protein